MIAFHFLSLLFDPLYDYLFFVCRENRENSNFFNAFFVFGILLVIGSRLDFDIVNRIVDVVLYPFANRFAAYD